MPAADEFLNQYNPTADSYLSQYEPSSWSDAGASLIGGIERGAASVPFVIPNLINGMVAGPQYLGRGVAENFDKLIGVEPRPRGELWQPFYGSEDALQALPPELRPHDPQTIAGHVAGFAGGLVGGVGALKAGEVAANTALPFYQAGRNKILGELMASKAENPTQAAWNIKTAPEYVPGSVPVAGVASGDIGLMGLQRGVEKLPASEQLFKNRAIQQVSAQNNELGNLAGNAADMAKLVQARDSASAPLYAQAKTQAIDPDAIQPVLSDLDKRIALAGPQNDSGKLLIALKNKIQAGLPNAEPHETGVLDANGNMLTRPADPTLQQPVIGTYRETRDALNLKGMQPGALGSEVRSNISPANVSLGKALEAQSPSFAQAQAIYKQGSMPIDQLEAGQAIKAQIQANSPNADGQLPIIQPKLQQLMENGAVNVDGKEMPLSSLTAQQQQGLKGLQSDLNRNISAMGSRVSPTPSSELNNLAVQSPITKLVSHIPWVKGIVSGKNLQLQQQLAKALLDNPTAAKLLLKTAAPNNEMLAQILMQAGINGSLDGDTAAGGNQ